MAGVVALLLGTQGAAQTTVRGQVENRSQTGGDQAPLAVVGDRTFTVAEVDARWKADSPVRHAEAQQAVYEGRRAAIDALLADWLLDRGAAAKGVPREQFEAEETARRTAPVTDDEIAEFYEANRTQVEGRSLEEMRPILREFLEEERKMAAHAALVAALRAAAPGLRVLLSAPRHRIALDPADPVDGPATAPVTIVEFADFECPFCQRAAPTLSRLRQAYGDRVRLVWKDMPLTRIHARAFLAAQAGRCAHDQGKFWIYHDRMFDAPRGLTAAALKEYAGDVGLNVSRFDACLDGGTHAVAVKDAVATAAQLGLSSTPTTFINGRMLSGARSYQEFAAVVDEELRAGVTDRVR